MDSGNRPDVYGVGSRQFEMNKGNRLKFVIASALVACLSVAGFRIFGGPSNELAESTVHQFDRSGRGNAIVGKSEVDHPSLGSVGAGLHEAGELVADSPEVLDPLTARKLIDLAPDAYPDVVERSMFLATIIRDLCEAGYSMEAWDMIDPNIGMVRNFQITQFFKSADLDLSMLYEKIRQVPMERTSSINGLLRRFTPDELLELLTSDSFSSSMEGLLQGFDLSRSASAALGLYFREAEPNDRGWVLGEVVKFHQEGLIGDGDIYQIFGGRNLDPFERWDFIERFSVDNKAEIGMHAALLRNMVDRDAVKAMSVLIDSDVSDFKAGMDAWFVNDPTSVVAWYERNVEQMAPEQIDAVSHSGFDLAMRYSDYDAASRWVGQVMDDELRVELEKVLDEVAR